MTTNEWEDTMGLTREIGAFVAGMRFERVPAGAVETVARGFTDCVGVMLAGLAERVASVVAKSVGLAGPVARVADFGETGLECARSRIDLWRRGARPRL